MVRGGDHLPLPQWAHVPGRTAEPDRGPLHLAKQGLPARVQAFVPSHDPGARYGMRLHDAGFFWEAHEVWEAVWQAAPMNGCDRLALRACIQIANAGLKRRMGRPQAAGRLVAEAVAILDELALRRPGADPASLAARLDAGGLRMVLLDCGEACKAPAAIPLVCLSLFCEHA